MLPQNIDLTENRDFRTREAISGRDFYIPLYQFGERLSRDAYESIRRKEHFFGGHPHENGRWYIFGDHRLEKDLEEHCERCGKEIKSPWNRLYFGICKECDYVMRRELTSHRFPWYPSNKTPDNRNTKEIFQLK